MTTAIDCALSLTCAGKTVARYLTGTMFFWMNLVNGVSDGGSGRASGSSVGSGFRSRMGALQALVQQEMRHESHRLFRCMGATAVVPCPHRRSSPESALNQCELKKKHHAHGSERGERHEAKGKEFCILFV